MKNKTRSLSTLPDAHILASSGRDELNIAEFPIALLTDRPPEGLKSLSFSDRMVDRGETITRTVTVEGTAKYGLPTPFDMDILLCLMQLTKAANNFTDPQVFFSRGDILKLMRLADSGTNYTRLDDSLRRWHGVSLFYNQSWWDREENRWTTQEGIHIFESINLITRKSPRRGPSQGQLELFRCSITWNSIFFKSCQSKNIKFLDMDKYFSLKRAISRQMYRFLDKRFYRGPEWSFDLREFAFEHIGISRNYDTGQIKSKLRPALEELEAIAFLEPLPPSERYQKDGKDWKIRLVRQSPALVAPRPSAPPAVEPEPPPLVAALVHRGMTRATAETLVRDHPERIERQLEYFDFKREKNPEKIGEPGGYLRDAIQKDYAAPKGFVSRAERQHREEARQARQRQADAEGRRRQEAEARELAKAQAADAYWATLSAPQRAALDAEVLARAGAEARHTYEMLKRIRGGDGYLRPLRIEYIHDLLSRPAEPPGGRG